MHWDEVRGVDFLRLLRHRGNLANCNLQLASSNHFIATVLRGGQKPGRKLASLKRDYLYGYLRVGVKRDDRWKT